MAKDSDHAVAHEEGVVSLFGRTWLDMPGDTPIGGLYITEQPDPYQVFTESAMDAYDRLQARRGEGRFARCTHRMDDPNHPSHSWAGHGFNRRDGESTT